MQTNRKVKRSQNIKRKCSQAHASATPHHPAHPSSSIIAHPAASSHISHLTSRIFIFLFIFGTCHLLCAIYFILYYTIYHIHTLHGGTSIAFLAAIFTRFPNPPTTTHVTPFITPSYPTSFLYYYLYRNVSRRTTSIQYCKGYRIYAEISKRECPASRKSALKTWRHLRLGLYDKRAHPKIIERQLS